VFILPAYRRIGLVAHDSPMKNGVDFYLAERSPDDAGLAAVAAPVELRAIDPGGPPPEGPTFSLHREHVQALVDRLWSLGFRPSEGTGSVGALAQAEAHIKSLKATNESLLALLKTRPSA